MTGDDRLKQTAAFCIGGTHSGSGKTTISLGIMAALKKRGVRVEPFKCGPDFIDPTLHQMVTGRVSRNLDLRMCGEEWCRNTFLRGLENSDVGIVEGVMGLFDGGIASSGSLAVALSIPVVLVIDVRSVAESVAAVVKGFELFDKRVAIGGVIFNRVGSERHEQLIREAVTRHCSSPILGFLPRESTFTIPDRHLGLHMGDEEVLDGGRLDRLAETVERCLDLDQLLSWKKEVGDGVTDGKVELTPGPPVRLGIARDKAFCFYYQDNLDLFRDCGFEVHFFSPLSDNHLPEKMDLLYFGGGYPELYGPQLSANVSLMEEIREFARQGGHIYSECGGFMYLGQTLVDQSGQPHPMAGLFPMTVTMRKRLSRLGYREANLTCDCLLGEKGECFYGHEFHYSEITEMAPEVETLYQLQDGSEEGYRVGNVIGGYLHLHFARNRENIVAMRRVLGIWGGCEDYPE